MHENEQSLEHYGVIGMKWGVRKDPQRAYDRSGQKLQKLDSKISKGSDKAQRQMEKAWRKTNRAQRAILFKGIKKWSASGQTNRAMKTYAKVQANTSKAMRWQKSREKVFKDTKVSNLNPEYERLGEKYSKMTLDDLMKTNVSMDSMYDMYARNKTRFNF